MHLLKDNTFSSSSSSSSSVYFGVSIKNDSFYNTERSVENRNDDVLHFSQNFIFRFRLAVFSQNL